MFIFRPIIKFAHRLTDQHFVKESDDEHVRQEKRVFVASICVGVILFVVLGPLLAAIAAWNTLVYLAGYSVLVYSFIGLVLLKRKSLWGLRPLCLFFLSINIQVLIYDLDGVASRGQLMSATALPLVGVPFLYGSFGPGILLMVAMEVLYIAQIIMDNFWPAFRSHRSPLRYPALVDTIAWLSYGSVQVCVLLAIAYLFYAARREEAVVTGLLHDILPQEVAQEIASQRARGQDLNQATDQSVAHRAVVAQRRMRQQQQRQRSNSRVSSLASNDPLTFDKRGSMVTIEMAPKDQSTPTISRAGGAKLHEWVAVGFLDIVGFTSWSAAREPEEVVSVLGRYFNAFDECALRAGVEKIKTIGDAYMCAAGVPRHSPQPCSQLIRCLTAMLHAVQRRLDKHTGDDSNERSALALRAGAEVGAVVAGIIGKTRFVYDLWGDTVNTASRMESSGTAGCIHTTQRFFDSIEDSSVLDGWIAESRTAEVKGKGRLRTVLLRRQGSIGTAVPLEPAALPSALTTNSQTSASAASFLKFNP